jgi:hypothetical protein
MKNSFPHLAPDQEMLFSRPRGFGNAFVNGGLGKL